MKKNSFFIEDNVAHELTFRRLFFKLWPYLRQYPSRLVSVGMIVLLYVLVGRALPILFGHAVDEGIRKSDMNVIQIVAGLFLICVLARAVLTFVQSFAIQKLGIKVLFDIRQNLLNHVQGLPSQYFDKTSSGRIMTRVTNDVHSLGELFSQGMTTIFINIVEMVSIFVALVLVSSLMTAVITLMLPPLLWVCYVISKKIRVRFGAAKRRLAMINAFTAESLNGMKLLQLFGQTKEASESFDKISGEYKDLQLQTVRLFATLWPAVEAFNIGTVAISLLAGSAFHAELGLSAGQIAAFILLAQSFFKPLRGILEKYNQLQNSLASADRVFQVFDAPTESQAGEKLLGGRLRGEIDFQGVSFSYSPAAPQALKGIDLKIAAGESVALIGRTGSGKSTLVALIQKLYEPQFGKILIDGLPLSSLSPRELRRRIGVVQQDNFIFRGTIATNINLENDAITRSQIEQAANQAHCQRITQHRRLGLDSQVEERGSNLSVGERQLIAFARVLAFDPDILILDEATANIDSVHERLIQEATTRVMKGRTSLIIAHRLSTVLHCDRIVLLNEGEILEQGSHTELMSLKGRYYELYSSQQLTLEIEATPSAPSSATQINA